MRMLRFLGRISQGPALLAALVVVAALSTAVVRCHAPWSERLGVGPMDFQARLSRDGTRIAFTRWWDDSLSDGVYVMKATGGDELFLAGASCPAWGSDGRTLAVRSESDLSISIIDAETGLTIRKVRDIGYLFGGVDWSHDGRWITFNAAHSTTGGWSTSAAHLSRRGSTLLIRAGAPIEQS